MNRVPPGRAPIDVLFTRSQLAVRIEELGAAIADDYRGLAEPPVLVGVLKGSALFFADLGRAIDVDIEVDFMSISSYQAAGHSGVVRIVKDLDRDISGRDVLLVEDIVDTGLTLNYLRDALIQRRPRSLRAVALLDKAVRRIVPVELEYRGFEIEDVFVVGYGLDFQGRYRNLPELLAVRDLARLANDPELLVDTLWTSRVQREHRC